MAAKVVVPSLDAGDLRQGWAYRDDRDLNTIGPIVQERGRGALNDHQKATWRRVQRFSGGLDTGRRELARVAGVDANAAAETPSGSGRTAAIATRRSSGDVASSRA